MSPAHQPSRRRFLAAAGATATAAVAGCGSAPARGDYPEGVRFDDDWPTFAHDDANTGYDPDGDPATDGSVAWTSAFPALPAGPTVAGGTAFVPTDPLRAVDPASGEQRWSYPYDGWRPPAVLDGVVYVPHRDEQALVGLDADSGEEAWRVDLPGRPTAPPVFDNHRDSLFVPVRDGRLCGVDLADAERRWTRPVYGEVAAPLAANMGFVFAVTSTGELYAFTTTGEPYWRRNLHQHVEAPPVVGDDRVYVGGMDERIVALDRRNGGLVWEHETTGFVESPMAFDGDRLYAGDGDLAAVDAATGEVDWQYSPEEGVRCAPAVVDDTVFVGTNDGALAALDADGGGWLSGPERWRVDLGGYVGHWLAAAGGRVFAPVIPDGEDGGPTRLVAVE